MVLIGRKWCQLAALLFFLQQTGQADTIALPQLQSLPAIDQTAMQRQSALEQAFARGSLDEALTPARALVEALSGDRRLGTTARYNLAVVQLHRGDRMAAIDNLQQVVETLRASGNFRDPRLAPPLAALGAAYYLSEDYPGAIEHIEQANFITRADKGLESLEQTYQDELLLTSLVKIGRLEDAADRLEASLTIHRQALSGGPELERALAGAARWYRLLELSDREGRLHEERLEILAAELGSEHPDLVPVHYDLAGSYSRRMHSDLEKLRDIKEAERNVSYSFVRTDQVRRAISNDFGGGLDNRSLLDAEWKAVRSLKLALRIQESQAEPDSQAIADTYVRLGDHYQLIGSHRKARRYYQRAYDLLKESHADQRLAELFGAPIPIYQRPMKVPATNDPNLLSAYNGEVELLLDINSRGEPRNIELLEVRPEQAKQLGERALRYSRDTLFRPLLTDNGIETAEKVRYIYRFRPSVDGS